MEDSRVPHSATFKILKEDHTIGHLLQMFVAFLYCFSLYLCFESNVRDNNCFFACANSQLMRDPNVVFAGYKIPHPLEHVMLISVQTTDKSDPVKAMRIALRSLMEEFDTFKASFTVCHITFFHFFFPSWIHSF